MTVCVFLPHRMCRYIETGREVRGCSMRCVSETLYLCCGCCVCVCVAHVVCVGNLQSVMNTTRTVFGKHSQGHIFPMLLNVSSLESSFAGAVQALPGSEEYILFLSRSLTVLEATQASLRMMGVRSPRPQAY